jgi:flagellar assembly protein FliH
VKWVPVAPHAESRTAVLRDVILQHQPHALQRPVQRLMAVPSAPAAVQGHASHDPAWQATDEKLKEPTYEDGLAAGYEQGYAAGSAAAVQEASREQEEALQADRQHAVDEGSREGYQKGLEQALAQSQHTLQTALDELRDQQQERAQRFEHLLAVLPEQLQERLDAEEDDMVALCHEVVCTMLGQVIVSPEGLRAMLDQVRGQLRTQGQVAVHLHPDDWSLTRESESLGALEGIQWVADPEVALGGLLLRSPQGSIDARLEVQLENLRVALLSTRSQRRAATGPRSEARP